jgi:hypothetical protein
LGNKIFSFLAYIYLSPINDLFIMNGYRQDAVHPASDHPPLKPTETRRRWIGMICNKVEPPYDAEEEVGEPSSDVSWCRSTVDRDKGGEAAVLTGSIDKRGPMKHIFKNL